MPTASSNRVALRYILESTYGVTPTTGNPKELRMTGESLAYAIQKDSTKEIRSDRQTTGLIPVGASASGGLNFELSYKEYDDLFQASFMDTWVAYGTNGVGAAASLTIDSAGGVITWGTVATPVPPTGADALTGANGPKVGQFFLLKAPGDLANLAVLRVAAVTASSITVSSTTPIPGSGSRAVAGSSISSSRLFNGTTQRSFSIERGALDVNQFFMYRGMNANKLSLSMASGAFVNGSFDFMGKDSVRTGATGLPGTPIPQTNFDVINALTGVGNILENGAALANTFIKSLKLDIGNTLRGQDAIGTLGFVGVVPGSLDITGELEVYLADGAMYDKFINNTASSMIWTMKDAAGNGYAMTLPRIHYSDAKVMAGSKDQDMMLSMPFTAILDSVTGKAVIMDRFGVA